MLKRVAMVYSLTGLRFIRQIRILHGGFWTFMSARVFWVRQFHPSRTFEPRPPSTRPSLHGERESFAVPLKIRATGFAGNKKGPLFPKAAASLLQLSAG